MIKFYGQPAKLLDNLAAAASHPKTSTSSSTRTCISIIAAGIPYAEWQDRANLSRAKYYAPDGEWHYARHPANATPSVTFLKLRPAGRLRQMILLKGGEEIVPGISVKTYPGTHRHMQAVMVAEPGRTACYISDLMPTTGTFDITWGMAFDLYPLQTIESRKYYAQAIPENG